MAQALVKAKWSDDEGLTTRINPAVAHYTGQTELADAIQAGLAAKAAGDDETATQKLGRAVQLAAGDRQRRGDHPAAQGGRHRRSGDRYGAAEAVGGQGGRDGPGHRIDQDHPNQELNR